jgi:hypothetical protein
VEYFESDVPAGDGRCSDNACPCPEVAIPRGTGYLYITPDLVELRSQYPSLASARQAMQNLHKEMSERTGGSVSGFYRLGPILVCEQGAKLRNLDLEVAGADARHWWRTGQVPLRATPTPGPGATPAAGGVQPADSRGSGLRVAPPVGQPARVTPLGGSEWQPIRMPKPEDVPDLECPRCPDILIPSRAVYLLEALGQTIPCPLCGVVLRTPCGGIEPWDLSFLANSPHLRSEESLVAEAKRLYESAKEQAKPLELARTRAIPKEIQLGGRMLLKWLETHRTPSDAVTNAIVENWASHIILRMIATDTFAKLTPEELEGFLVIMQYASAILHQADQRAATSKFGHGMRGRLILNLMTCYEGWKDASFSELPYDARLGLAELVYSLQKDKDAYPADSGKAATWAQFDQTLKKGAPPVREARGCRKSVPRKTAAAKKKGCFVATAAYSADATEVAILRRFRDRCLVGTELGEEFIRWYYATGPKLAKCVSRGAMRRFTCRLLLYPLVLTAAVIVRCGRKETR